MGYYHYTPTNTFLNYNYRIGFRYARLYDPNAFSDLNVYAKGYWNFKNFWDATLTLGAYPMDQHDYYVLNTPGRFVKDRLMLTYSYRAAPMTGSNCILITAHCSQNLTRKTRITI
jgi:hypothetical protein